jgi:hypothetical protein
VTFRDNGDGTVTNTATGLEWQLGTLAEVPAAQTWYVLCCR